MLNWNFLETFIILSENLSFSATAQALNTAQPVVSRQIKTLEDSLGYALFIRTKKKVMLSQEGHDLKLKLRPLVEEIKKLTLEKHNPGQLLKGTIRVGSMPEAGFNLLQPKISAFTDINPDLQVHVTLMPSATVNELVMNGTLDFGFVYLVSDRKSLKSFPVTEDFPVLISEKKVAKNWRSLPVFKMIGYREKDLYQRTFIEGNFTKSEQKKVQAGSSINSHMAIIDMVCSQKAFAVIPKTSVIQAAAEGRIEILMQEKKAQSLYLICHEQILIDKKKKAFLDYLIKEFSNSKSLHKVTN